MCEEVVDGATSTHMTETGLIRDLERRGIGRPSTFAHIVETLKEREYATVKDIEGVVVDAEEWRIVFGSNDVITTKVQRTVGAEKSKLVVSDVGKSVADFLSTNFPDIFAYEFTAQMEKSLDDIVRGEGTYGAVCARYDAVIRDAIGRVERTMTENAGCVLDERHTVMMGKHGLVVRETDEKGKHVGFHGVNLGLDVGRVMRGEIGLEDLMVGEEACDVSPYGTYEGHTIEVKKGRYGYYAKWGTKTCNLKRLNVPIGIMCNADVVREIEKQAGARDQSVVRVVNDQISIRKGKRGMYLMYVSKSNGARKPKPVFHPMADFWDWFYATESMGGLSGGDIALVPDHVFVSFVNSQLYV
jgi:DNA topoisomerase-1